VVDQARQLVERGYLELVLTGVDLTSYGKDLPGQPTLGALARRLLRLVPELARLRLSSLDPAEIDRDLLDLLASEPRLMPHLHLSVQAGDDLVLKRMKRRHSRADVVTLTRRVRALRPDVAFGADLIAGFPTENEAMFKNTLDLIEEAGLAFLHVFPYSPRPGTPAVRMPEVPKTVRKARAGQLRAAGEKEFFRLLQRQLTHSAKLLVEREGGGRLESFAPFRFATPAPVPPPGRIVPVVPERIEGQTLIGRAA
jgi:threonylcarbamoyladenosine tRNA methylthiotransferase MtaB